MSKDKAEINILQAGLDLDNSYLFLARDRFGVFGFNNRIEVDTTEIHLAKVGTGQRMLTLDARAQLPSFCLRIGPRSAIAFTNSVRIAFNATGLDLLARQLGVDTIELAINETRTLEALNIRQAAVSWTEHGLTFARTMHDGRRGRLHVAATAKLALGLLANQVDLRPPDITAVNDSTDLVSDVNVDYALVYPHNPLLAKGPLGLVNGTGWNGDIGFIYEYAPRDTLGRESAWHLRLGGAVTDLGELRYDRRTETHRIRDGAVLVDDLNAFQLDSLEQLGPALSQLLLKDPGASLIGHSLRMGLPATAHLSLDYGFLKHWALRAELSIGLREVPAAAAMRDVLAVVPRFETRMVSVAAPITVDRVARWAAGLCLRVGGFMIGSDRVGGLFGLNEVAGADLYFGAKVRIRAKPR